MRRLPINMAIMSLLFVAIMLFMPEAYGIVSVWIEQQTRSVIDQFLMYLLIATGVYMLIDLATSLTLGEF